MAQPNLQDAYGPMLTPCTADGCSTIVLGKGTCTEHDPKTPAGLTETLLKRAAQVSDQHDLSQPSEPEQP